jgi:tetratricopeptide (TPR) repeat protein
MTLCSFRLLSGNSCPPGKAARGGRRPFQALRHWPLSSGLDLYKDCLAGVYLEFGRLGERSTNTRRILQLNPNYPLAQDHLGRAFERKGKVEQAKVAYERFLRNWKSTDADIPEIAEAKKKFATGLAATDSEALNGWSRAGRVVAKQSLTNLREPEVTFEDHL